MNVIINFLAWLSLLGSPRAGSMKSVYPEASPYNDEEFEKILAASRSNQTDLDLEKRANAHALLLRSRAMNLAAWHADFSPEYEKIISQCKLLTAIAGNEADQILKNEFLK